MLEVPMGSNSPRLLLNCVFKFSTGIKETKIISTPLITYNIREIIPKCIRSKLKRLVYKRTGKRER